MRYRRWVHIGSALLLVCGTFFALRLSPEPAAASSTGHSWVGMTAVPDQSAYEFAGNIGPIVGSVGDAPYVSGFDSSGGHYSIEGFPLETVNVGGLFFGWIYSSAALGEQGDCNTSYSTETMEPFVFVEAAQFGTEGIFMCDPTYQIHPDRTYRFTLDWVNGAQNTQFTVQDVTVPDAPGPSHTYADFQTFIAHYGYSDFHVLGESDVTNANPDIQPAVWIGGLGESNAVQETYIRYATNANTILTWNKGNPNGTGIDDSTCTGISGYQEFNASPPEQPYDSEAAQAAYYWVQNWTIDYNATLVSPPTGPTPTPSPGGTAPSMNPLPPSSNFNPGSQLNPLPSSTPAPTASPPSNGNPATPQPTGPATTATPSPVSATVPLNLNPLPPDMRLTPPPRALHAP